MIGTSKILIKVYLALNAREKVYYEKLPLMISTEFYFRSQIVFLIRLGIIWFLRKKDWTLLKMQTEI